MHTTVDYSRFTPDVKQRTACADALAWLGPRRYKVLAGLTRGRTLDQFSPWAGFTGISGYPVRAMWERYHA